MTDVGVEASSAALHDRLVEALPTRQTPPAAAIALVGCGWIGGLQLEAYRSAGLTVVALCDRNPGRAAEYRDRWFPDAVAYDALDDLLRHPGIDIIDVATHVDGRPEMVRRCLSAGFDVLSQKPFVEDLNVGRELAEFAGRQGRMLAVNQNGRWAPHFRAMLACVDAELIGEVVSADFSVAWPHDEVIAGMSAFESMDDLVLFDFGAHWFDLVGVLAPPVDLHVSAAASARPGQRITAPLQASAIITGEGFIGTVDFRAGEQFGETGGYRVSGTRGVVTHTGMSLGGQAVRLECQDGSATITVGTDWFSNGLAGSMLAALDARASGEVPGHSAASALRGLAIAFAALEAARSRRFVAVGAVRTRYGSMADAI